jgi:Na+-translocating ferredoxin:NAD+ oxidoreductase RNF subunit RnfB
MKRIDIFTAMSAVCAPTPKDLHRVLSDICTGAPACAPPINNVRANNYSPLQIKTTKNSSNGKD